MSFLCHVKILFYILVYVQIRLARISVWSAVENGVNVRENDASFTLNDSNIHVRYMMEV